MSRYNKILERKRKERRRKSNILIGTAAGIILFLALPRIIATFGDQWEFSDFFLILEGREIITTDSGLQYQDHELGSGAEAKAGDLVSVHYTGWLKDGTVFDTSYQLNKPFEFVLGQRSVIAGWDEGVAGMKAGGVRILMVPAHLGYGTRDLGVIPPNSILIFQVELLQITSAE